MAKSATVWLIAKGRKYAKGISVDDGYTSSPASAQMFTNREVARWGLGVGERVVKATITVDE